MSGLKRLIVEIHRRSVWQVLGIYAVGSWVAYQVVLALVDGVGLPEWVPGMALAAFYFYKTYSRLPRTITVEDLEPHDDHEHTEEHDEEHDAR